MLVHRSGQAPADLQQEGAVRLPFLVLLVLAGCAPEIDEVRCEIDDDGLRVSFPVSSEKECDRIHKARGT